MRHYLTYIACALAIVFAGSCVKIDINPVEQVPAGDLTTVTLQLKSSDLVATRASVEDDLNENLIKHVQCFFYESDTESTVVYATDVITIKDGETVGKNSTVSDLKITIPSDKMNTLFAGDNSCMVYVVANGPVYGISVTEGTTTGDIKTSTAVSLDQYEIEGEGELAVSKAAPQTSFIMDGAASVTKQDNTITGTVPLYRVAAKVLVKLHVANKIVYDNGTEEDESDDVEWTPLLDQIRIKYINSVTGSKLDAEPGSADPQTLSNFLQQPYADYQVYDVKTGTTPVECTQVIPFYTYPYDWNSESSKVPSISLLIPWTSKDGVTETFEYQIPINPTKTDNNDTTTETKSLVRNTVYEMTVDVAILGGLTGKVTLNPSYIVTDWGTGAINAELSRPKYLIVDENYVVMNNENTRAVGYASSDDISVLITKIEHPNLKTGKTTILYQPEDDANGTTTTNGFTVSYDNKVVTLNHELDNDRTDGQYDYFPYTVTVVVTNAVGFSETIVFKQYPAIYVDVDMNTDYENGQNNDHQGYTSVNDGSQSYGSNNGLTGTNKNPSMYIINISSIDSDEFIIGDPRSLTTLTLSNATTAPALYPDGSQERNLQFYYPTDPESDKIIAPKFRIASSYGVTSDISYNIARQRCAFYQEDGYPAGRWRMPTPAEIKYMIQFANEGKIDILLSPDTYYWSGYKNTAYQYVTATNTIGSKTNGNAYVRCVYDEWYWGSDKACDINTFTWGDALRN